MAAIKAYVIRKFNPGYDLRVGHEQSAYLQVGVYSGRTAHDALRRFAEDNGITITDGPGAGGHWLHGRKHLASFGAGQYHADVTSVPALVAQAK